MKKIVAILTILVIIVLGIFAFASSTYAEDNVIYNGQIVANNNDEKAIDNQTEGKLVEIKEKETKSLKDYQEKYGSSSYGLVAYILNIVRIYSIPFCFLGIIIGVIHQYVIGVRKLDTLEKGYGLIVTFVTILIICQVLPLAFAMFVKFGRG